jgi:hypothetical protein
MAAESPIKLAEVQPYIDLNQSAAILSAHYGYSRSEAVEVVAAGQYELAYAGF